MIERMQYISKTLLCGTLCALLVAPIANAASIFAVNSGGPAVDSGTRSVGQNSTTSIDIYLAADPTEVQTWGYTVNLYTNGSVLANILVGPSSTGDNWMSPTNWRALGCSLGSCGGVLTLIASMDVTVGVTGTSLTADGEAQGTTFPGGGDMVAFTSLVTAVPEPGTALLLMFGIAGLAISRRKLQE